MSNSDSSSPRVSLALALASAMLGACAAVGPASSGQEDLRQQVVETERAFALTMAKRDFTGFATFVADEAVFLADDGPLRGKAAVLARWERYFRKPEAPFSWAPGRVEVLDSGTLALSSGPVYDAKGRRVATFTSVWRLEAAGRWRIVFDKGDDACDGQ